MDTVYLDQASTSSPKAEGLGEVIARYFASGAYTVSRGQYEGAVSTAQAVYQARKDICQYFGEEDVRKLVFTGNVTHSLNLVTKGLLKAGDEVICSSMEHNALMRPLYQLSRKGVKVKIIPASSEGELDPQKVEDAISPDTKALAFTAASNVCGTCLPLADLAEIAHKNDLYFIVDSAQVAGHFPWQIKDLAIDAFCFTGHKALRGPQGIGGVILSQKLAENLEPLISGGTGSYSDLEDMPPHLPDRFEAGTPNLPGILGLGYAVELRLKEKPFESYIQEMELLCHFLAGLEERFPSYLVEIKGLGLQGAEASLAWAKTLQRHNLTAGSSLPFTMPLVSLNFPKHDNAAVAFHLENEYGIMTRSGLHCAPRAHKTLGTFPQGTVRFSLASTNTLEEIDYTLNALEKVLA
jgi:selenocysteine lyase/cysteine desulfurase